MRLLLLLLLSLLSFATVAAAQTVRVDSGEHGSFTRLVFIFPSSSRWEFGRTDDGYAFRLAGQRPRFAIDRVFDKIGRNRLALVRVDEQTATLRLGLACPCHAFPFEFRPGVVVVDLRDGQAPPGSAFELPLFGAGMAGPMPADPPRPEPEAALPDVWVAEALGKESHAQPSILPILPSLPDPSLTAMRQELMEGFARAASDGLIDPVTRLRPAEVAAGRPAPDPTPVRVNEEPLDSRSALAPAPRLSSDGDTCPAAESLALADWGDKRPVSVQFADYRTGLSGEFDQPSVEAVVRSIRFHLHLGFGAEVRALLGGIPIDHPDKGLWLSMARLLDGGADPDGPFPTFAACDGPAAFWAALADPTLPTSALNLPALLRSYSALPPHLRRYLGPPLVERFLAAGDRSIATQINDILQRLPSVDDPRLQIVAARIAEANGAGTDAERAVSGLLSDPGPAQPEALVTLVDLSLDDARAIDDATIEALAAYQAEEADPQQKERLARAHLLALALAGRFDEAFAGAEARPDLAEDLWSLAGRAEDGVIIGHAFGTDPSALSPETRRGVAERLLSLGFPEEADRWALSPLERPATDLDPARRAIFARDWSALSATGPDQWRKLANLLDPARPESSGPLSSGRVLASESQSTRAAIEALLSSLPDL